MDDRWEGRGRAAALTALVVALLCWAAAAGGDAAAAVRESVFVDRAAAPYRAVVDCYDRPDWAALVSSAYPSLKGEAASVYGLWRYDVRQVALPARACVTLEGWRRARPGRLAEWIFVLGHELTHAQQSDLQGAPWKRPFDEVAADCGGYAKFESVRLALGITRRLEPPPRTFSRCPLRRVVRR